MAQQVRIIGGKWKGRKLRFQGSEDLRPTLGRTRETLFNWLRPHIQGSRCLDLFSGSGALAFEALSQGAQHVVLVEANRLSVKHLKAAATLFDAGQSLEIIAGDAQRYLKRCDTTWDIVFLDPPYDHPDLLDRCVSTLRERNLLGDFIYAESRRAADLERLGDSHGLAKFKQTRAGDSTAALFRVP